LMESSDGQLVGLDLNGQFFAITGHWGQGKVCAKSWGLATPLL
jgi:hypothetical protein